MSEFGVDGRAAHDQRGRAGRRPPSQGAARGVGGAGRTDRLGDLLAIP
jgi:hypothetical protein